MENKGNTIKIEAYLNTQIYPKLPQELSEDAPWGVIKWEIIKVVEGDLKYEKDSPFINTSITITGEYGFQPKTGMLYTILAKETEHPKYGKQYQLIYLVEKFDSKKAYNQRAFLREILTPLQIEELYKIADNPLELIENKDTESLLKAKGMGPVLVEKLYERYEKKKDYSSIFMALDSLGLSSNLIRKLIQTYRMPQKIIDMVKNNPYQLTYDVDGIGFIKADEIALKGGINPKSTKRIGAYINYYLREQGEMGHSYVTATELLANIYNAFGGKDNIVEIYRNENGDIIGNNVQTAIQELQDNKIIVLEDNINKAKRRVYLLKYYNLEKDIAYHLKRLMRAPNHFNYRGWEEKVKALEAKQGFEFTDEQLDGIKLGLESQVCYITGLAGCGKSSLVSGILAALDNYSFAQTALSGRAAAQLQEITGETGQTIHRLLSYSPVKGFMFNEDNPLPYDIIVLDELSLVGGDIFLYLVKAIKSGSKLICLGDSGQLESIGALNLAADIMNSENVPTVKLKKVHRQAQKSGILTTAYDVRNQIQLYDEIDYEGVEVRGELQDMILDIKKEKSHIKEDVLYYFKKYYDSDLINQNIMDIQVLAPVKTRGEACVHSLNLAIQDLVNPISESKPKFLMKKKKTDDEEDPSYYIQKDDKVMCIKNNYTVMDVFGGQCSIFNGWLGIVKDVTETGLIIDFPLATNLVFIDKKEIPSHLILGYASTVHKCQGSGFKVVIGALDFSTPPNMLTCQLLYTLFTRARILCVLVGQTAALRKAIATNFVSTKRTFLKEFLKEN